eukprot:39493-Prymnesium_polylepis.2
MSRGCAAPAATRPELCTRARRAARRGGRSPLCPGGTTRDPQPSKAASCQGCSAPRDAEEPAWLIADRA